MSVAEFKTHAETKTLANLANTSELVELKPKITVIGVGGAGGNAVNNMIRSKLQGVQFIVCNTDSQSLMQSLAERRIQLGDEVTQGLGAGSRPETGRAAAEESMERLLAEMSGSNMVFITAGMGGGTGTGAAPVVAQAARERGILTVAVVTKPFHFEGQHRMKTAEEGIRELSKHVDTLIIIPNQNLFRIANEKTTFADAFKMADDVLHSGVRGVTDLMMMPGLINLDFADIRAIMSEMGKAMMGTGEAEGDGRALMAAEAAISNPLLDDVSMKGAQGVLINITGGYDMTLYEVDEAANRIREEVDPDANIIFGSTFDDKMVGLMRVSVVATGIESDTAKERIQRYRMDREAAALEENTNHGLQTDDTTTASVNVVSDDSESAIGRQAAVHPGRITNDYTSPDAAANGDRQNHPLNEHRYDESENEDADNYQRYMTQEPPRPVKRGFFSRLAETMRGGLGREERPDHRTVESTRRFQEDMARFNADNHDSHGVTDQKVQDVPAYLRRNKKS